MIRIIVIVQIIIMIRSHCGRGPAPARGRLRAMTPRGPDGEAPGAVAGAMAVTEADGAALGRRFEADFATHLEKSSTQHRQQRRGAAAGGDVAPRFGCGSGRCACEFGPVRAQGAGEPSPMMCWRMQQSRLPMFSI